MISKDKSKGHFYKGVDISSLPEKIDSGALFYSEDGTQMDPFDLLESKGIDSIRLRIWNDPKQYPESNGYCDLPQTLEMAKKIKSRNLHFMLDFHYSDYWADPGQQRKPVAWEGLSFDELKIAVYDYTKEVLLQLKDINALPDIVQVGNEIRSGMIFPEGEVPNYTNLAALINAGIHAVRDVSDKIKVMIHLDQGGRYYYLKEWFDSVFDAGMDPIDAIGISFYSFWHGTFQDLKDSMTGLIDKYNVPVYVVETAHPWRQCEGEHVSVDLMKTAGLPAGIEEQKHSLQMVCQIASEVSGDKDTGVYYWEPLCITNSGFGSWDQNMGMLDDEHRTLPGFDAYRDFDPDTPIFEDIENHIKELYMVDEADLVPVGTNIVPGGDFENGVSGWWIEKTPEEDVLVEERDHEIYVSAACNFKFKLFREIRVDKPGKYQLMVDYRGTNTTGVKVRIFLKTITYNGEKLYTKDIFPSDVRFVTHSIEDIQLDTGSVQLGIEMDTPPVFGRIANIKLIEVDE